MRLVKKYIYIKRSVCNFHRTKYSPEPRSGIIPSGHTYTVFEQTTAVCLKIKGRFNFIKGRFNFIKGRFNFLQDRPVFRWQTYTPLLGNGVANLEDDLKKTPSYRLNRTVHRIKAALNSSRLQDGTRCGTVPLWCIKTQLSAMPAAKKSKTKEIRRKTPACVSVSASFELLITRSSWVGD